jgi:mono/diheme cytochrome c family protein
MKLAFVAVAAVTLAACAAQPAAQDPAAVSGRLVAERACGACHSTSAAPSRLSDAPRFRDLHLRYGPGGLDALLEKGMLTPDVSLEEGVLPGHPRMPMVAMTAGERQDLAAWLRSLEPRP